MLDQKYSRKGIAKDDVFSPVVYFLYIAALDTTSTSSFIQRGDEWEGFFEDEYNVIEVLKFLHACPFRP